uniref:N-acetyltransferase domain-containing protein n=1 Tax=viral metagenome TaxID=1070528 RepID=A0A6C0DSD8_9ZZZZ
MPVRRKTLRRRRSSRRRNRQHGGNQTRYMIQWYKSIPPEYLETINNSLTSEFVDVKEADLATIHSCGVLVELVSSNSRELAAYTIIDKSKGRCWYIKWLTTLPAHRGKGLAKGMLRVLKSQTVNCVTLHVAPNSIASEIYAETGFTKTGKIRPMKDDLGQDVHMEEMIMSKK